MTSGQVFLSNQPDSTSKSDNFSLRSEKCSDGHARSGNLGQAPARSSLVIKPSVSQEDVSSPILSQLRALGERLTYIEKYIVY